jgi:ABC-2 type transport system ATP-binding protein
MSSHLLDDVERVCDHIVLIDQGRLLRAGPLETFLAETAVLSIETDGSEQLLAAALAEQGLSASRDGGSVLVDLSSDDVYDRTLATLVDLNLPLIRMERRRQSLIDLFNEAEESVV